MMTIWSKVKVAVVGAVLASLVFALPPAVGAAPKAEAAVCSFRFETNYYKTYAKTRNLCGYSQSFVERWRNGRVFETKSKVEKNGWATARNSNWEPWDTYGKVW